MVSITSYIKSCATGAALLFSLSVKCLPGDSLKKKSCVCETYQAIADREYLETKLAGKVIMPHKRSHGIKKRSFLFSRSHGRKPGRRKIRTEKISQCWK